jgi:hypothetical protein
LFAGVQKYPQISAFFLLDVMGVRRRSPGLVYY